MSENSEFNRGYQQGLAVGKKSNGDSEYRKGYDEGYELGRKMSTIIGNFFVIYENDHYSRIECLEFEKEEELIEFIKDNHRSIKRILRGCGLKYELEIKLDPA